MGRVLVSTKETAASMGKKENPIMKKNKKSNFPKWKKVMLSMLAIGACGVFLLQFYQSESVVYAENHMQKEIAKKILRFHVLANSDVEEDQELKLKVRDAIGAYLSEPLKEVESLEECKELVSKELPQIVAVADETIAEAGYSYTTTAQIKVTDFPEKTYGDYTFPAGEYEALEVTIGAGEGHNWWCVLYPNMCFRGSVYEVVEEDAKESLKEVLTPEEYQEVFSGGDYEVRLKVVEEWKAFLENITTNVED